MIGHCIIHQRAMRCKMGSFELEMIRDTVIITANYSHAPHNDVSVNTDVSATTETHIRLWSHRIIIELL
jgi:hypothetical protein